MRTIASSTSGALWLSDELPLRNQSTAAGSSFWARSRPSVFAISSASLISAGITPVGASLSVSDSPCLSNGWAARGSFNEASARMALTLTRESTSPVAFETSASNDALSSVMPSTRAALARTFGSGSDVKSLRRSALPWFRRRRARAFPASDRTREFWWVRNFAMTGPESACWARKAAVRPRMIVYSFEGLRPDSTWSA